MKMDAYRKEVEAGLRKIAIERVPPKWKAADYVGAGQSRLTFLDLKIPSVRALAKRGFSFSDRDPVEQWPIWNHIWQESEIFEAMLLATQFAARRPVEELVLHDRFLLSWLKRVDNWAHSDELSGLLSKMLEYRPNQYMRHFRQWNQSANPWLKRQSMVVTIPLFPSHS